MFLYVCAYAYVFKTSWRPHYPLHVFAGQTNWSLQLWTAAHDPLGGVRLLQSQPYRRTHLLAPLRELLEKSQSASRQALQAILSTDPQTCQGSRTPGDLAGSESGARVGQLVDDATSRHVNLTMPTMCDGMEPQIQCRQGRHWPLNIEHNMEISESMRRNRKPLRCVLDCFKTVKTLKHTRRLWSQRTQVIEGWGFLWSLVLNNHISFIWFGWTSLSHVNYITYLSFLYLYIYMCVYKYKYMRERARILTFSRNCFSNTHPHSLAYTHIHTGEHISRDWQALSLSLTHTHNHQ